MKERTGMSRTQDAASRQRRRGQIGAQAIEYVGLSSAVATLMVGAVKVCQAYGPQIGELFVNHLKAGFGQ
jgi:hypothetical protein